jgi:peptidoglycan hydrolase-like protein with peptidoglycan-binding domain
MPVERCYARRVSPLSLDRRSPARAIGVALAVVGLTALAVGPAAAGLTPRFPAQSLGDRGTDVATIQQLFRYRQGQGTIHGGDGRVTTGARNPFVVAVDGVFGPTTRDAVQAFQASRLLPATGVVEAATWGALVVPLGPGAQGDAVAALQRELREKRRAAIPLDGVYGASTTTAVMSFQAHMGLPQTGATDLATWRALVWHFEEPRFSAAALCDYDPPANANWGTAEMIATIEAAGAVMVNAGYGRVAVGDLSYEHGGDHPEHDTHEVGLDADIRPMRKANDQCSSGSNWRLAAYDRTATRALIKAIRAATPGHVKKILFNDPQLIAEGLTVYQSGHDDHLHVRICEVGYPDPRYRC